jgi:hypothetical protein
VKGLNQPLFHKDNAGSQTARVTTDYPQEKMLRYFHDPLGRQICRQLKMLDVIGTYEKYNDMGQLFLGF